MVIIFITIYTLQESMQTSGKIIIGSGSESEMATARAILLVLPVAGL